MDAALDQLRALAPIVLAAVVRRCGDFATAEDVVQEALLAAATRWPRAGVPADPRAWLIQVALRRFTDHVRGESARRRREAAVEDAADDARAPAPDQASAAGPDETLTLLFLCCHPALSPTSAIALTLRAVGGLTTAEIAKAFFVPEPTMAQRISRAKQSIQDSGVPFELPRPPELPARLATVLHVLYLIFSEGYTPSTGATVNRTDLSSEALRLTRLLARLLPDEPEVSGLLALMLLTDARRAARTTPDGALVPLDQQDRRRWDRTAIEEGVTLLTATLPRGRVGPYQIQAAIAAVHDESPSAEATDWPQILTLYDLLQHMTDNPMVALNHTIALAMVRGPTAALTRLDTLAQDPRLATHHRLDAVRAHLLERAGDHPAAISHYRRAADRTTSLPERTYLLTQAARLQETG